MSAHIARAQLMIAMFLPSVVDWSEGQLVDPSGVMKLNLELIPQTMKKLGLVKRV